MLRQSIAPSGIRGVLAIVCAAIAVVACGESGSGSEREPARPAESDLAPDGPSVQGVRPGLEVLLTDSIHLVEGRRVGLITNHTGIDREGVSSIDRLFDQPDVELVALFSPEHGIRGTALAGAQVSDEMDERTQLPVHSLYGATLKPTPEMLDGLDLLAFDIQDIGARYYTYVYTMALAMEAAGEAGIPFVVLDRPNPIGGALVQGNVLDPAFSSFVGRYPLPMRHGMTPAELARLFRSEFGVSVDLQVVPMDGWTRDMRFPDTGLPWRAPSPNMPDVESATHYAGTCLFEGTNLSVGRGTDRAFQWIGAPWLDGQALVEAMEAHGLEGVRFVAAQFTPDRPGDAKFDGVALEGVRLEVTDPDRYDPTVTSVALLVEARRVSGDDWAWNVEHFDRLAGTQSLRIGVEQGSTVAEITEEWSAELDGFQSTREANLIAEYR